MSAKDDISKIIEQLNREAEFTLALRRERLGIHRPGWHCGRPNPYAVGFIGRSDAWDW